MQQTIVYAVYGIVECQIGGVLTIGGTLTGIWICQWQSVSKSQRGPIAKCNLRGVVVFASCIPVALGIISQYQWLECRETLDLCRT